MKCKEERASHSLLGTHTHTHMCNHPLICIKQLFIVVVVTYTVRC